MTDEFENDIEGLGRGGPPSSFSSLRDTLRGASLNLARHLATSEGPASVRAAAMTGAMAAGLLERAASRYAEASAAELRGRARQIAGRAAGLQISLSALAERDARLSAEGSAGDPSAPRAESSESDAGGSEIVVAAGSRCGQVATFAAELLASGDPLTRSDLWSALRLSKAATETTIDVAEDLRRATLDEQDRRMLGRWIWQVRLVLHRARGSTRRSDAP